MKRTLLLGFSLLIASGLATAEVPSSDRLLSGTDYPTTLTASYGKFIEGVNYRISEIEERLSDRGGKSPASPIRQRPVPITGTDRNISRKSLSGAELYTWMGSSDNDPAGWYTFDTDGTYKFQWTNDIYAAYGINITNGWIKDNRLCGLAVLNMGGMIVYYNYVEFDLKTGQMLKEEGLTDDNLIDMGTYYISCAYVPEEDRIYGYTNNSEQNGFNFCSSPASAPGKVTVIKESIDSATRANALCYNPEDKAFYGVTFSGDFVKIDANGKQDIVFTLPLDNVRNEKAGLVYSPYDGCYLYTPTYYYYASQLYYIYPEEKQMRFVRNFPSSEQFFFFINNNYTYNAAAPGRPVFIADSMEPGALSGEWTLKMPELTAGGETLTGNLKWTLYIDNSASKSDSTTPGAEVNISVGPLSQGEHVIRVSCTNEAGIEGLPYVIDRYFGNGMPLAPESVTMTTTSISWTPVNEAVLGGYLEPGKMRYEVYVNDSFMGSTQETSFNIELDPEIPVTAYCAYVAASCNNQVSERTKSNKVIFGAPIHLPYTVVPTAEQAELTETFNRDGSPDYGTWEFWETRWHEPVFASGWSHEQADDWLILPPVNCPDLSHAYRVTLDAICGGMTGKDERFEVWCGNEPSPEAMNTLIIPETQVTEFITEGWETFSNLFVPKKAGSTYIAIRAVSPPDQHSLIVRKIVIEATDELADVPEAPVDFTVTGKSDANLTADVTLTMPVSTIAGSEIAADADLRVFVGVNEKWTEKSVAPGEKLSLTVNTYQGDNRLVAYCSLNGQNGQETTANIFTGTIPPNFIQNFNSVISRDNMSVGMTWEPPVSGQENLEGYYSPEGMHYWLFEMVQDPVYGDYSWQPTKNLGNVLEYTYELPEGAPLEIKYMGIAAANLGGVSAAISYTFREIGTPYKPEIKENFIVGNEPGANYKPLQVRKIDETYTNVWEFMQPEMLGDDLWNPDIPYAMINYTETEDAGGKGCLQLPKFSTSGVSDPGLTLTLWTSEPCIVPISIFAQTYGTSMEKIYDIPFIDKGWQDIVISLPKKYYDMPWIQLSIHTNIEDPYTYALIGGYKFGTIDLSGISATGNENGIIVGAKNEIRVVGLQGQQLVVSSLDGKILSVEKNAGNDVHIKVPSGIYIVRCAGKATKVFVR